MRIKHIVREWSGGSRYSKRLAENFPELMKYIKPQIQVAGQILNKKNTINIFSHTEFSY